MSELDKIKKELKIAFNSIYNSNLELSKINKALALLDNVVDVLEK